MSWVQDLERTIEYLQTRQDLNLEKLAFFGVSWGARMGAIIPAIEPRFKAVILMAGGLASGRAQPEVDQINYVTRVRQPVLMLNGKIRRHRAGGNGAAPVVRDARHAKGSEEVGGLRR